MADFASSIERGRPRPPARPAETAAIVVAIAVVLAALVATLSFAIGTLAVRPLDGVEGEALFEAARIRAHLALYTDPIAGATDLGPVPARFYVLYPPLWPLALSVVPAAAAPLVARAASAFAWWGTLAAVAATARPQARAAAALGAAFIGGVYTLALYGGAGRPDAVAVACASSALAVAARRGKVPPFAAALFVLAAWIKPNVIGLGAGALLADVAARRRAALPTVLAAALTAASIAAALHVASGGAWIVHLVRSTGQPLSARLFAEQVPSRLPFFALLLALGGTAAWRGRADAGVRLAGAAIVTSAAWTLFSLAKIGSATNYWMEPSIASLVALANAPLRLEARAARWVLFLLPVQALYTGVAGVRSSIESLRDAPAKRAALDGARAACGAQGTALVMADEPGLELELDGRILSTPFQLTHLARRGRFPLSTWIADVERPEVGCLVMQDDLLERPAAAVSVEHDRFGPEMRAALVRRFELARAGGGLWIYRPRGLREPGARLP